MTPIAPYELIKITEHDSPTNPDKKCVSTNFKTNEMAQQFFAAVLTTDGSTTLDGNQVTLSEMPLDIAYKIIQGICGSKAIEQCPLLDVEQVDIEEGLTAVFSLDLEAGRETSYTIHTRTVSIELPKEDDEPRNLDNGFALL